MQKVLYKIGTAPAVHHERRVVEDTLTSGHPDGFWERGLRRGRLPFFSNIVS